MSKNRIKARQEAEDILSMVSVIMDDYEEEDVKLYLRTLATGLKPLLEKAGFVILPENDVCAFYYRLKRLKIEGELSVPLPGEDELTS